MITFRFYRLGSQPWRTGWLLATLLTIGSLTTALAAPAGAAVPADTVLRAGLRGQVVNQQKQPQEFATVLLRRAGDSTLVGSLLSDEQGRYQFAQLAAGRYYVHVKQLGYRDGRSAVVQVVAGAPGLRLPPLVLAPAAQALAEVQVTGRRPPIERQIDRMVVHVDQLPATAGGSAFDIIKGAPGVTVTGTDAITMQGKNGVLVLIDDRPVRMSQDALLNMLRNMPAESIQSLEVITTPPARYDAEGNAGIINIRTRQRQQSGWNTDVTLRGGQGQYSRYSGGAVASLKHKAVDLNGSYFLGRTRAFENITQYATQRDAAGQPLSGLQSTNRAMTNARYHDAKAQLDVKTGPKTSVGLVADLSLLANPALGTGTTTLLTGAQPSDTTIQTLSNFNTDSYNYSVNGYYTVRLDSAGRSVSVDANYARYHLDQQQSFLNQGFSQLQSQLVGSPQQFRSFLGGNTHIRSLKADVTLPLRWAKLETGAKYSAIDAANDFLFQSARSVGWENDALRTNQFDYHETTYAAYGSASKDWGKVTIQLGLRGEYTRTLGVSRTTQTSTPNNYFQLFPTAYVQYKASDTYQTNLSYSRRIERPAYSSLNPFLSYQSQFFSNQGNPFLQPAFTDAVEWSNLFKNSLNVAPFFNYTSQFASEYPVQNPTTRETVYTFGNLGYSYNYGVTIVAPFSLSKWWKVDNNLTVYQQTFRSTYAAQPQQNRLFVYNLSLTNSFTITPHLTAQLSGYYNSPTVQGFYHSAAFYAVNAGATLKLLQDKGLLSLSLGDIFYTERGKADVHYASQDFGFYRRNDTRLLRLAFTYKLGNTKLPSKDQRSGAGQEERSRAQ
jgi:outer membrane receptor for ferrienterochelin and colicin